MPRIAALLAAGGGSRFHGDDHKLLAPLRGRPVWEWALEHVVAAEFDTVLLVTGAVALELPDALAGRVTVHHNPAWARGQAGSVQVAVHAARELGATEVTIGLADQPFIGPDSWAAVAGAPSEHPIVIATYEGVAGPNPVRLGEQVWSLLPTDGDTGARDVIRAHPEWVYPVACVGSVADVDTLEDLERWNR
ncbi:MAG: nucleotidyltransferase family protein [Actinomycetota bacterium]|nr:nucleotidyltransferase family protein [Actinomycetota bacterium]